MPVTSGLGHWMILPRLGLIGSFAFHGAAVRRVCPVGRGALESSSSTLTRAGTRAVSAFGVSREMSATEQQDPTQQQEEPKQETTVVAGVRALCDRYEGFVLDQFGVLHGARLVGGVTTLRGRFKHMICCSLLAKSIISYEYEGVHVVGRHASIPPRSYKSSVILVLRSSK